MMKAHLQREALQKKRQAENEKLMEQHLIASVDELSDTMSKIDTEACTAVNKRSRKLAIIKTQRHIRKKVFKQNINITLTRSRKQRSVADLLQELSDFIRTHCPFSELLEKPHILVGSRIKHRFETNGERKWFGGMVVSYDPITRSHEIKYDEEEDLCSFDLSIDIVNGDFLTDN